jgi:hypothetical protein
MTPANKLISQRATTYLCTYSRTYLAADSLAKTDLALPPLTHMSERRHALAYAGVTNFGRPHQSPSRQRSSDPQVVLHSVRASCASLLTRRYLTLEPS